MATMNTANAAFVTVYNCVAFEDYDGMPETLSKRIVQHANDIAHLEFESLVFDYQNGSVTKAVWNQERKRLHIVMEIFDNYEKAYFDGVCHKPHMLF